jgi:hypothetical protein
MFCFCFVGFRVQGTGGGEEDCAFAMADLYLYYTIGQGGKKKKKVVSNSFFFVSEKKLTIIDDDACHRDT